jgi:serine/threonine-protein kinase ULK/ATG1
MSKFYMKNNMVIDHPHEIQQKEAINDYALEVVKGNAKKEFKGELIKRNMRREEVPGEG